MLYTLRIWHQYDQQLPRGHTATLTVDPAAAFAAVVCLLVIACRIQWRCGTCGAIPARCRCGS